MGSAELCISQYGKKIAAIKSKRNVIKLACLESDNSYTTKPDLEFSVKSKTVIDVLNLPIFYKCQNKGNKGKK